MNTKITIKLLGVIGLLYGIGLLDSQAQNLTTSTTKATASLSGTCTIAAQDVNFGTYNPSADSIVTNNVTLFCTKSTSYTWNLSITTATNQFSIGSGVNRTNAGALIGKTDVMGYGIWNKNLGDWSQYSSITSGTGTGSPVTSSVNFILPKNEWVTPQNYSGAAKATINF